MAIFYLISQNFSEKSLNLKTFPSPKFPNKDKYLPLINYAEIVMQTEGDCRTHLYQKNVVEVEAGNLMNFTNINFKNELFNEKRFCYLSQHL